MYKKYNERKKFIKIIKTNPVDFTIFVYLIDKFFKASIFDMKALSSFEYNFKQESSNHLEEQILYMISSLIKQYNFNIIHQNVKN